MPPVKLREYFSFRRASGSAFSGVTFTMRGRDAIALAARHFGLTKDDRVLLPAYLCDTVTGALAPTAALEFYDIREDFTVDPVAIEERISEKPPRVFYLIHYFGFLQPHLAELAQICRKYGVLLWEDLAHAALSRFSWDYADAMIFSFRKILPAPDGGGLWIRNLPGGPEISSASLAADLFSLMILVKRILCNHSIRVRDMFARIIQGDIDELNAGRKAILPRPAARMSRRIICNADIERDYRIRREQFRRWEALAKGSHLQPVFSYLPEDVCPQGFPIWIGNPDEVVGRLERVGIFLKIHWLTMPAEVAETCPVTWRMSRSIVTLPIYVGLTDDEMQRTWDLVSRYGTRAAWLDEARPAAVGKADRGADSSLG